MSVARVRTSRFAARQGATLSCQKCGNPIQKGETYRWYKIGFRSRYKYIRCSRSTCTPRMSELESSKMVGVWSAVESAEDALDALAAGDPEDDASSIASAVNEIESDAESVADEYDEAADASPTGMVFGEDLHERADGIRSAAQDLGSWSPTTDEPDYDSCDDEMHDEDAKGPDGEDQEVVDRGDTATCGQCAEIKQAWWDEAIEEARTAIGDADWSGW
jgi:hypothetical protein